VHSIGPSVLHFGLLKEACIPRLKSIRLIVTELCFGQAWGEADADTDDDNDAADKSNPYMSPFQGDTKMNCLIMPYWSETGRLKFATERLNLKNKIEKDFLNVLFLGNKKFNGILEMSNFIFYISVWPFNVDDVSIFSICLILETEKLCYFTLALSIVTL
jgi:hypothetical protein